MLRVQWDQYEVAKLIEAYWSIKVSPSCQKAILEELSAKLRQYGLNRGYEIDDKYRNFNGMCLQLSKIEGIYTDGERGLMGARQLFQDMVAMRENNREQFDSVLCEANRRMGAAEHPHSVIMQVQSTEKEVFPEMPKPVSLEVSFFAYLKGKTIITKDEATDLLQKAADYCHFKQSLLGTTNVKVVQEAQQKVANGKLLRFKYGKIEAQKIRDITSLYCSFIKEYQSSDSDAPVASEKVSMPIVESPAKESVKPSETSPLHQQTLPLLRTNLTSINGDGQEWIIAQLRSKGLTYCDKRAWGGCLWIVAGRELAGFASECKANGYTLAFKPEGCKAYPNKAVWWTKGRQEPQKPTGSPSVLISAQDTEVLDAFTKWMRDEQFFADSTVYSYRSAIKVSAEYIVTHKLELPFLHATAGEAKHTADVLMTCKDYAERDTMQNYRYRTALKQFILFLDSSSSDVQSSKTNAQDDEADDTLSAESGRWLSILEESFPDGYMLDDFLSQFQASAYWQEKYGKSCPIEGEAIDQVMMSIGSVRDGRVFKKSKEDHQLIADICSEINGILSQYANAYQSCVYNRYREPLAQIGIYTDQVMTQQLLKEANGAFILSWQIFVKPGRVDTIASDCRKVLRAHGGAMHVDEVAAVLWFVPRDTVYHALSVDEDALNIGNSTWMLAEHFPLNAEDAKKVGDMLDECFLTQSFIQQADLMSLLQKRLPSIADNLSSLNSIAIFNILSYYLKNRFSFSKAIISPKGTKTDFRVLFTNFAREHEQFTLEELSAFANELQIPIYWESIFSGGAVRVSKTEFVQRSKITFDVDATDNVLQDFCPGDYLPLQAVSTAMMMHLPLCGYSWNGYLLLSYVLEFSKVFRLIYNSLGKTGGYGAIVRKSCTEISDYEHLIERVLIDENGWQTEADALALLVRNGYQARQRFNGIDQIVARAKQRKQMDGR